MVELVPGIRNAVRALILKDSAILVQHKIYDDGTERYVLPGGAPKPGETLSEGLLRECLEEIGCEVIVDSLIHIADFYKPRETIPPTKRQQVEFIFRCHVAATYTPQNGAAPDKHQKDVVWLKISEIENKPFFPRSLSKVIVQQPQSLPVYLGLID